MDRFMKRKDGIIVYVMSHQVDIQKKFSWKVLSSKKLRNKIREVYFEKSGDIIRDKMTNARVPLMYMKDAYTDKILGEFTPFETNLFIEESNWVPISEGGYTDEFRFGKPRAEYLIKVTGLTSKELKDFSGGAFELIYKYIDDEFPNKRYPKELTEDEEGYIENAVYTVIEWIENERDFYRRF